MTTPRVIFLWCGVTAVLAGALGWQHAEGARLRGAVERAEARVRERDDLQAENRRLAAAQPSDAEMESLVSRLTQAEQLRGQLAALRAREDATLKASASMRSDAGAPPQPSLAAGSVGAAQWQNVGQGSADAAFETALWAAASGDLDTLTGTLALDAAAHQEAAALFARLPASVQTEMATPERMVAVLTAMDVPLGRAAILRQQQTPGGKSIVAQLIDPEGRVKTAAFSLRADGDRWQLQVPASVLRKYAAVWDRK